MDCDQHWPAGFQRHDLRGRLSRYPRRPQQLPDRLCHADEPDAARRRLSFQVHQRRRAVGRGRQRRAGPETGHPPVEFECHLSRNRQRAFDFDRRRAVRGHRRRAVRLQRYRHRDRPRRPQPCPCLDAARTNLPQHRRRPDLGGHQRGHALWRSLRAGNRSQRDLHAVRGFQRDRSVSLQRRRRPLADFLRRPGDGQHTGAGGRSSKQRQPARRRFRRRIIPLHRGRGSLGGIPRRPSRGGSSLHRLRPAKHSKTSMPAR